MRKLHRVAMIMRLIFLLSNPQVVKLFTGRDGSVV